MNIAVYSTKSYDEQTLSAAAKGSPIAFEFFHHRLTRNTAKSAIGYDGVCLFVNDIANRSVIEELAACGVAVIALRCSGFNQVDLQAAKEFGITVVRVPAYSPEAVAEHAAALVLTLNRKTHRAYNRVREGNFELEGLMGFDLHAKFTGVVGTGMIGQAFARIMSGFGCHILACDPFPNLEFAKRHRIQYVDFPELLNRSDIISLHCPLTRETHHLFDSRSFEKIKPGAMLINTGRGALLDTKAAITALKSGRLGYLGIDVYEEEAELFFRDRSGEIIQDDNIVRLMGFPNVLVTGHQGFFTKEALEAIARVTVENLVSLRDAVELPAGRLVQEPGHLAAPLAPDA